MINSRSMGTKSDGELSKFLQEEIQTEKKNQRSSVKLDGWNVKTDGSEVTLTKSDGELSKFLQEEIQTEK